MRKSIIYCLVAVMLVGLVPVGASATEENIYKYKVVIYPNGNVMQTLGSKESLMLGDVEISYNVNYDKNTVDIYFEESIFVSDVISEGDTIHESIKFNDYEAIEVDENLETSGYRQLDVDSIVLEYEDISGVSSITLYSSNIENYLNGYFDRVDYSSHEDYIYIDNDFSTGGGIQTGKNYLDIEFYSPINISGYIFNANLYSNDARLRFFNDEGQMIYDKNHYNSDKDIIFDVNLRDVKRVIFDIYWNCAGTLYEFEIFETEDSIPPEEVYNLDFSIDGQDVILKWINPNDIDFKGANIYRNDVLLVQNYEGESYIDEKLEFGLYKYKVTAIDEFGNESEGVTINVIVEKPPEEVTNLDYTVEDDKVTLTWANPTSENFEGVNIYRDGKLIKTTIDESFSENLPSGVYQYRITTMAARKESPGITIDVSVYTAPTTVKNLRIINRTSTGGTVAWDLNPAFENVEKYIIYVNGEKHGEIEAPPYPLEGLEEGKTYTISVQAVNSYGISEPPSTVTFTPTELSEIGNSIKVGDIFSYVSMLFKNMWPLLAIALAILLTPKVIQMIKSSTG